MAKNRRKALASKLKRLRLERGYSTYRVAKLSGLTESMIRTMEGRNPYREPEPWNVSVRTAMGLVSVFGPHLSLQDFLPVPLSAESAARTMGFRWLASSHAEGFSPQLTEPPTS